jgi:glycosyltransferase involved in cell wall biosynthesis
MSPLRIALVVQGRFHAFDLARALLDRGHDVGVFTNYPASAVEPFGVPGSRVRSFVWHGLLDRAAMAAAVRLPSLYPERRLHELFGRWAAKEVSRREFDVVHSWSGVSLELLSNSGMGAPPVLLMRGSAHIRAQDRLLRDEEGRAGVSLDRPSAWMIGREEREYARADRIVVLSSFARRTFVAEGCEPSTISVLPLGVDVGAFRVTPAARDARSARIRGGGRLRVLYVGALSFRKGLRDLLGAAELLSGDSVEFTLVGPRMAETERLLATAGANVRLLAKRPQAELPEAYAAADLFVFPSIEDGFGMVLTQAKAAGLPIITTDNCAGSDLVTDGRDGWIVPIRDARALADRLRWCAAHRPAVADMARAVEAEYQPRSWGRVAGDFEAIAVDAIRAKRRGVTGHEGAASASAEQKRVNGL